MVITEKLNHFRPNTFIKIIEWKPEQWALYTKTIRIVHIKNQTSAKTKKPFILFGFQPYSNYSNSVSCPVWILPDSYTLPNCMINAWFDSTVKHPPVKQIENFVPLDEPERVLRVCLPHEQVLHQKLVVLVRALHVQVRQKLDKAPTCFTFLEEKIGQNRSNISQKSIKN